MSVVLWTPWDLAITYLLILISCHCNKLGLFEDVGSEGGVGQLENVAGPHKVEPGLVLVHRVQDRLGKEGEVSI